MSNPFEDAARDPGSEQGWYDFERGEWTDGEVIFDDTEDRTILIHEVGEPVPTSVICEPRMIGGRGAGRKGQGVILDAIHRAVGNVHSHSEDGGDIREVDSDRDRSERHESGGEDT